MRAAMPTPRRLQCHPVGFFHKSSNRLSGMSLLLLFFVALMKLAAGGKDPSRELQTQNSTRDGFSWLTERQTIWRFKEVITLVQNMGSVSIQKEFYATITSSISSDNMTELIEVLQSSSNEYVLEVSEIEPPFMVGTDIASGGVYCNISVSLSFDRMVGETDYNIVLQRSDTKEVLFNTTVHYIICGITLYQLSDSGVKTVVSGNDGSYRISYKDALNHPVKSEQSVHAFIQYPDGSTSEQSSADPFPLSEGCNVIAVEFTNQFIHDPAKCDWRVPSSLKTSSWGTTLSPGCGYGFTRNANGELFFVIRYSPYRVGRIIFDIRWDTLIQDVPVFSDDGYDNIFTVFIDGNPPLVVTEVEPRERLFREEGGQALYVTFFNGQLYDVSDKAFAVESVSQQFKEVVGTCTERVPPLYLQTCRYVTQPGNGQNLSWAFTYRANGINDTAVQVATDLTDPSFLFNYDPKKIRLDSLTPNVGLVEGGILITADGYFEGFDATMNAIFFTGHRLQSSYYVTESESQIIFMLPPKFEIGEGYDFDVDVGIGNALSNSVAFSYLIENMTVTITQSGTTQQPTQEVDLDSAFGFSKVHDVYYVGNCTRARFTAIVTPFTKQVKSYEWSLFAVSDTNLSEELFRTFDTARSNLTNPTTDIEPEQLTIGRRYVLFVNVTVPGLFVTNYIYLDRIDAISIGAYILDPPVRSIAFPDTPVRFYAEVTPPLCMNLTEGLIMEWKAFGKIETFSDQNATGILEKSSSIVSTPARLGREFIVPQSDLVYGTSEVIFKTWMRSNPRVNGIARVNITIVPSALKAVIRNGESSVPANTGTTIMMTATNSFDPDDIILKSAEPWVYEWACQELSTSSDSPSSDFSGLPNVTYSKRIRTIGCGAQRSFGAGRSATIRSHSSSRGTAIISHRHDSEVRSRRVRL
jgi:hypothetical protein